jgi:hypothetical protein
MCCTPSTRCLILVFLPASLAGPMHQILGSYQKCVFRGLFISCTCSFHPLCGTGFQLEPGTRITKVCQKRRTFLPIEALLHRLALVDATQFRVTPAEDGSAWSAPAAVACVTLERPGSFHLPHGAWDRAQPVRGPAELWPSSIWAQRIVQAALVEQPRAQWRVLAVWLVQPRVTCSVTYFSGPLLKTVGKSQAIQSSEHDHCVTEMVLVVNPIICRCTAHRELAIAGSTYIPSLGCSHLYP